jgi:transcriptional regulator with XRE-family HTH domain
MDLIDADWIKRHLSQRHGELKALADATGLSPDKITKILKGQRQIKAHEAPRIKAFFFTRPVAGFEEDAEDFRSQVTPMNATARIMTLASALCPNLPRPVVYRVKHNAPASGLVAGDMLVVQLGMTAQPGDLVIVTIADTDHDVQTSVIRRYWPPLLVPISPDDPFPALLADGDQSSAVVASVKAVARGGVAA